MSTKRWFARRRIILESEQIDLRVPSASQLVRTINGASSQIAVTTDIPVNDVVQVNIAAAAVSTIVGTFLTYDALSANTSGVSFPGAGADNFTITKKGNYIFHLLFTTTCGAAPEVPFEIWTRIEIGGIPFSSVSIYNNGGTASPTRNPRILFVHKQSTTTPTVIRFELQGDSIPNGTVINLLNSSKIFVQIEGISPI